MTKHFTELDGNLLSLATFMRSNIYTKTHELDVFVVKQGIKTCRQQRDARILKDYGFVRRLTKEEQERMYGKIHEGVWKWISDYSVGEPVNFVEQAHGQYAFV